MPFSFEKKLDDGGRIAFWEILENESFFLSQLSLSEEEQRQLAGFKAPHRRQEWLAIRMLVKELLSVEVYIGYHENGMPFLHNSDFRISISHSKKMAGVFVHPHRQPGLDIEIISDKVEKVKHKFMSPAELASLGNDHFTEKLLIHWCAKESLLKMVGRKDIDFIQQLKIKSFDFSESGTIEAVILLNYKHSTHLLNYFQLKDYMVVYGI